MKVYFLGLFSGLMFLASPVWAQKNDDFQRLDSLFHQRDVMFDTAHYLYRQNNAFFGGKSKSDLQNIIRELQRIIAKDSEIIMEVHYLRANDKYVNFNLEHNIVQANERANELQRANQMLQKKLEEARNSSGTENVQETSASKGFTFSIWIIILLVASNITFITLWLRSRSFP